MESKATQFPTDLQRRLAGEVTAGMKRTGQTQADLSRRTGIGEPHISLLLHGHRVGSMQAWDALIVAANSPKLTAPDAVRPPVVAMVEDVAVEQLV